MDLEGTGEPPESEEGQFCLCRQPGGREMLGCDECGVGPATYCSERVVQRASAPRFSSRFHPMTWRAINVCGALVGGLVPPAVRRGDRRVRAHGQELPVPGVLRRARGHLQVESHPQRVQAHPPHAAPHAGAAGRDDAGGRGLHSSTFRLNISMFCGMRWLHEFSPNLLDRGTRRGVTKTA